jgi:hypothetical protein
MPHERYFQNDDGISINSVEAFSTIVKSTIESASESVTTYGYHLCFSVIDPARTTGSTGSTQGARIVSMPARNDEMRSAVIKNSIGMCLYYTRGIKRGLRSYRHKIFSDYKFRRGITYTV